LVAGRAFTGTDTAGAPAVGMVNKTMADLLWPGADAVGKIISVFGSDFTVVGVVADIHQHSIRQQTEPEMYRPFDQWPTGGMFSIVRTVGDPMALGPLIQQAVWSVDPDAPLAALRPLSEVFGESVAGDRFVSLLIAAFGFLALVLGALGVYGVTSYATSRRINEFGVRMALGADRSDVVRQAVLEGIAPALAGVVVGIVAALWATTLLANLLYNVAAFDPVTFVAVPAMLTAIATVACAVPAWRASRLDPSTVLRD
jgi:putative ABC transport system permease protein